MEDPRILESWKAIASYLGRSVRACSRWEAEYGLPVHRLDGSPKARVFAYKDELDRWLEEKLHERESGGAGLEDLGKLPARPGRLSRPKIVILATVLLVTVLGGVVVGIRWLGRKPPVEPSAGGQPVLAVVDFENKSGDARLDHWRSGLPELLIGTLSQSKFIRITPGEEMYAVLKSLDLAEARRYSSDDLKKVALKCRASHVLSGSFMTAGGTIVVTASLDKPGADGASTVLTLDAKTENEIIPKMNDMARQVMTRLNFTEAQIAVDLQIEAGRITTSSPEALRYYVEGQKHLFRYEGTEARECFEKAIEIDSEFALAYRALAQMAEVRRDIAEARRYTEKALRFGDRLPENERLLIQGQALYWDGDFPGAIAAFERLLKAYPDNAEGLRLLSWVYESTEDIDPLINHYEAFYRITGAPMAVWGLGVYYSRKGWYQKAENLCRSFIERFGDHWRVREVLVNTYVCLKRFGRAREELERVRSLNPEAIGPGEFGWICALQDDFACAVREIGKDPDPSWSLWHIALFRGRFSEAVELARRSFKEGEWDLNARAAVYGAMPFVLDKAGRYREALEAVGRAQQQAVQSQEPWLLGLLDLGLTSLVVKAKAQAEMGSFEDAERTAEALRALIEKESRPKDVRWHEYATGLIECGRRRYPAAISHLKKAADSLYFEAGIVHDPHALLFDALARAYYESGDMENARLQYERITQLTSGRMTHGDIYARAFYELGKIAERTGDKGQARERYRKFLALWKDADPGLPDVDDARRRLSSLAGN